MKIEHLLASLAYEEMVMSLIGPLIVGRSAGNFHLSYLAGLNQPRQPAIYRGQTKPWNQLGSLGKYFARRRGTVQSMDRMPYGILLLTLFQHSGYITEWSCACQEQD